MESLIQINAPPELMESLSKVIHEGLQRAKISSSDRKELMAWWDVEKALINEDLVAHHWIHISL